MLFVPYPGQWPNHKVYQAYSSLGGIWLHPCEQTIYVNLLQPCQGHLKHAVKLNVC